MVRRFHIDLIERLWTGFRSWRARRETVRQLHSVDSATLRELGISPEEIEGLVYRRHDDLVRRYDPDWWRKLRALVGASSEQAESSSRSRGARLANVRSLRGENHVSYDRAPDPLGA